VSNQDERPVLPEQTGDDTDRGWGDDAREREDDDRILRELPPHHGTY
jgi:hypothetical protein